ncbi:hypothetical protein [Pseudomonas sp.]|uniref:hypothetical protein n=1 Tax=Pseudomonas sp. TaxID=306 RepID=UPI003FD896C4
MDPLTIGLAIASQFAPALMKYFTNSDTAATVASQVIGIAQTVTGSSTAAGAQTALAADPALALEFQTKAMANETELQRMYIGDVQNARSRDVEIVKSTGRNTRGNILAAGAGFIVVICLAVVVWQSGMDDYTKATISLILGRALGWVENIFSFEFGLTRESAKKDDTIKNLSK